MTAGTIVGFRVIATSRSLAQLSHFRHALAVEVNFADAFDPRQHVINRLAPDTDQLAPDDPGNEIARQLENFLRRPAVEAFAEDRRHGAGERLHFRTERHAKVRFAFIIDLEINADGIGALLVFANVFERKRFAGPGLLFLRVIRIGNEGLAPLHFRKRFEEANDGFEFGRIAHS